MQITVRYLSVIRDITGIREETINVEAGTTVEEVLQFLVKKYGDKFNKMIRSGRDIRGLQIIYFFNGQNIKSLEGFQTKIENESELVLIPPVAGG
jgi:MoaD family protein